MSDPLSVAGSAVGVVSLGIQVCQGLVFYLRSIRGRQQELANDLREVRNLISVFHSLNDVLPRLAQQPCADRDAVVIRQCLLDCEEQLVSLQLLVVKLQGPTNPGDIKGKMKEAGRAVLYPFREGELASIRRCLQRLLNNLSLALNAASVKLDISHNEGIGVLKTAIEGLDADSHVTKTALGDLSFQVQQNSDLLASLDNTVSNSLDDIKGAVTRTEWIVRDVERSVNGNFTVMQTDMRSIESRSLVTNQAVTELLSKVDAFSEQLSGMESPYSASIPPPEVNAERGLHHATVH
ncbi:hypothetical protein C8A00DRAFT_33444 [Chaetomidium leptoderma]|uniref:Fungal N-terminal domain-containing protein n=1 Tax=Chaetomidium leptoderma TaxID=669021 RepID=A0AAN6ZXF1_9PEZI|nr:hypothetical protein C8A00DRAFT_33444 [Chaetomidium leptoderma]